jgi:hypothetical protein
MVPNQVSLGIEAPKMPLTKGSTTITCSENYSDITTTFAKSINSIITEKDVQ